MRRYAESWDQVQELFNAAVDLPGVERAAMLEQACAGDEALRLEVESLLHSDEQASSFIEDCASQVPRDLLMEPEREDDFAGRQFGAYQIIREIGRGGLGAVYLAARADDEFQKQVAIKVVRRGLDTDDILRRFRAERQILAQLEHPNIGRLIDAGSTEEGLPYFVMEHVDGQPITGYCDAHKLSTTERLELFRLVCGAVTYAHQHLVIHRDIKPSNILVSSDGAPKLLDFGIAKVLHAADPLAALTMTGGRAMTPDYASPEQVRGEPITTSTDIYSLGVLLYELLTGQKPYRLTAHTPEELSRAVIDQIPERPSTALVRTQQSEVRNQKSLRGDLDNIILMAMRKEPARRYSSTAQLSGDIERHQRGLPVIARKDTFSYRAEKFIRRNTIAVAAAVLVLLSLIGGTAIAVAQARRATVHARIAEEQRDAAHRASVRAEKTSRFMQSFLSNANPNWYARGNGRRDVTVREAIDDAVGRMDTELADEPEVRGDLHHTIGEIHRVAGEPESALNHFQLSLDSYRQAYGDQHPKVAMALYYVSVGVGWIDPRKQEAEPLLRQGIAMMRKTDPENINLPYMLQHLATQIMSAERQPTGEADLAEAESLLLEAKPLFVRYYGEDHLATLSADSSFATLAYTRGDLAQAETMREETLRRFRQVEEGGYSHIRGLFHLAQVKLARGKSTEAETLFEQAVHLGSQKLGGDFRFKRLIKDIDAARAAATR